ncbi:MAG: single-stranded-DNA-specific exonuclease RecJ [Chloroflexota bacterium]|nr:MAG: single-stranded-DNA-specific exonuclease RecJ [Chloroflexota bacterium]
MLQPRARWVFPTASSPDPLLVAAGARLGLTARVVGLLERRGIATAGELERHLGPAEAGLNDPSLLPDADRFQARIEAARAAGERVLVFGDFDADGITGLAILSIALRAIDIDVIPYVPSRLDEGHGLSLAAVETAGREGARVIVTVDTGTTSVAEISVARSRGIDVLVTDHHRVPAELPDALALVNAHRPDSAYPDSRLSGAGIAFALARLLLGDRRDADGPAALALADLATIGTVADVAPILGENRAIVRLGLERIRAGARPGIAALLTRAGVAPEAVNVETIAFALAPRLNAAGRVGEAFDAARLLLARDADEAEGLAATLEAANATRRDLMKTALAEARTSPDAVDDAAATLVHGPWPVGIVGLVAGRLAEERGRPALVGADLGSVIRVSARGDGKLHLADAIAACGDLLVRHGGHAGAAGFEIDAASWGSFRERFLVLAAAAEPRDLRPSVELDLALPAAEVDYRLFAELARLAPCGVGNPEPVVAVLGLTVTRAREASGGHSQLVLKRRLDVLDGIAFGWPELASQVAEGDRIDVIARLASRRFGGLESLQLEIRDAAPSGQHPEAAAILATGLVPVGPGVGVGAGVGVGVAAGAGSEAGRRP